MLPMIISFSSLAILLLIVIFHQANVIDKLTDEIDQLEDANEQD